MVAIRFEDAVPRDLADLLRRPIEQACDAVAAPCDVFVYSVGRVPELMVRVAVGSTVVPVLFHTSKVNPASVLATVKGALARAEY
jgi:hypothetical protein